MYGSYRVWPKVVAGLVVIGIILSGILAAMSATTVGARSVGIQTQFGRYVDTLPNGFHWTNPFSSVEEFSTQVQDLDLEIPVAFDGGSNGNAVVTVLWAIDAEGAEQLWKDWKTFDRVRDRLVAPAARTAIAADFSTFTPDAARDGANRVVIEDAVLDVLRDDLEDNGVKIREIQLTDVQLGQRAQEAVDRIVEATANTQRASEEKARAVIEAETAAIRQRSQTPEALQRYCLEVVNAWDVAKNGQLPATFNCQLDGASTTPVIVNSN